MEEYIEVDKYWLMDLITKIEDLTAYVKKAEKLQRDYEYSRFLTPQEVSKLIGFSVSWIERRHEEIGCSNFNGNRRFKRIDVEAFMELYYFRLGEKRDYELPVRRRAKRSW